MPTIPFRNLLEPKLLANSSKNQQIPQNSSKNQQIEQKSEQISVKNQQVERISTNSVKNSSGTEKGESFDEVSRRRASLNHLYISPALYATPEPTPAVLDSSLVGSVSPSPYVCNRKGRRGSGGKFDGFEVRRSEAEEENGGEIEVKEDGGGNGGGVVEEKDEEVFRVEEEEVVTDGGFFDPRCDALSVASSTDVERGGFECSSFVSNQGEFFDAIEDFSSDGSGSIMPSRERLESELRDTRLNLLEEIERQKIAEDALVMMHNQWQRFVDMLSRAGFTFPPPLTPSAVQLEVGSLEQFAQEVIVARFVAEAIGKGEARAEAELAAEVIIESKDQELSRLRDRLQYYEAVNNEMSRRNLEIAEVARMQRQKRKGQRKLIWGCIGISIAIGASVIAYSYLPQSVEHPSSQTSGDLPDASCN